MRELFGYGVLTQEQTFSLFEIASSLQVDATVYNIPLRQASETHNLDYARDIVDYMENTPGVTPNSETYRLLITAHKGSPYYKDAGAVLEKLRSFDAAEVEHYTALIELYGGEGEVALCVETFSEFTVRAPFSSPLSPLLYPLPLSPPSLTSSLPESEFNTRCGNNECNGGGIREK